MSNNNNPCGAAQITRVLFFFSGLSTAICGVIHVANAVAVLTGCQGSGCIGPSLVWGAWIGNANSAWRSVFTLSPNNFVRNFLAVFLGIITMSVHFPGFTMNFLTRTWMHVCVWSVFVACFGDLPYAGNVGVIAAGITVVLVVMSFILYFTHRHEATTLNISFGHSGVCSCLSANTCVVILARFLSLGIGLFTFVIGLIHVFSSNFNWCPQGNKYPQCLGPSIRWNQPSVSFITDCNDETGWRGIFTLQPETVGPLWGPTIIGIITTLQHMEGHEWQVIFGSWPRCVIWFLFVAFFANFGYVGNLGIICGFGSVALCLIGTLITFGGGGKASTHFTIRVRGTTSNQV